MATEDQVPPKPGGRFRSDLSAHPATRLLAAALTPFVVLWILLRGVLTYGVVVPGRWAGHVLAAVGRALERGITAILDKIDALAGATGPFLRRIFTPLARVLEAVDAALTRLLPRAGVFIARLLGPVARVIWRTAVLIARLVGPVVRLIGRVVSSVLRVIGRVLRAVGIAVGTAMLRAAVATGSWIRRRVWPVIRAMGRACAWLWRVAIVAPTRFLTNGCVAAARLLSSALSHLGRLARGLLDPLGRAALTVLRPIGRAAKWMLSPIVRLFEGLMNAMTAAGGTVARALFAVTEASTNAIRAAGDWVRSSSRLALSSARRRSQRLAGTVPPSAPSDGVAAAVIRRTRPVRVLDADPALAFTTAVYQNAYLPPSSRSVSAVLTVTADQTDTKPIEAAEVILIDCSSSMAHPRKKMECARLATQTAVDGLRDGVWFAVVGGTQTATVAYPVNGGLARASALTKTEARAAVMGLRPGGGTAIGAWLKQAAELFSTVPGAIHHAILLTDGRNEAESDVELDASLAACEGEFQCDCRGVGTDWEVAELRKVATTLLGTVDIITRPEDMEADFRALTELAMGRVIDQVDLRVWTPRGAQVRSIQQVSPAIEDLATKSIAVDEFVADYPTGAWGAETRQYQVALDIEPGVVGDEMLAARVKVVVGDRVLGEGLVRAIWTDDILLSTTANDDVSLVADQIELARDIQEGLEARRAGDDRTATVKLGRAVQLANQVGNAEMLGLLSRVVDVEDPVSGTVRVKRRLQDVDEMTLDTRSTKTLRVPPARPKVSVTSEIPDEAPL